MAGKIKIFHIVEAFEGGVFASVSQLCNHLDKGKFDVYVIHSMRPATPPNYRDFFGERIYLEYVPMVRNISPLRDFTALLKIARILKEHNPDVVHLHSSKAGVLGRIASAMAGIKNVFYSPRGYSFLRSDVSCLKRSFYRNIEKVTAQLFGGTIIACSTDELAHSRGLSKRCQLIPNAVDLSLLELIPVRHRRVGKPVVVTSGRITAQKDPSSFGRIANSLHHDADFIWVGDGEMVDLLRSISPVVRVTGWKTRGESIELVASSDIYVQTSLWEGMPISVLEAMALGKPVVARDIVGNRDLVRHGFNGFLARTEEEFIAAIRTLIADSYLAQVMGEKGRNIVYSKHSMEAFMEQYVKIITESAIRA